MYQNLFKKKIISAEAFVYSEQMVSFGGSKDLDGRDPTFNDNTLDVIEYQVQFEIEPGDGILEGDFRVKENTEIQIGQHFSRLNAYGQLSCDPNPMIREFCVCEADFILNSDVVHL